MNWKFLFLAAGLIFSGLSLQAEPTVTISASETRLREALRTAMLQLRTAQEESAALQAKLAEGENEKTLLKGQLESVNAKMDELFKKSASEKEASDKAIAALQAKVSGQETVIAQLNTALEKWKEGYKLAVDFAQAKEGERAKSAGQVILLQRKVEDRETKNLALFKLGNEILTRYEKFSLGDALAAKEPFTGIARARMQGLVRDYQDKLVEQKIKPEAGLPAPPGKPPQS
jgi:chromosome segregation ATPase